MEKKRKRKKAHVVILKEAKVVVVKRTTNLKKDYLEMIQLSPFQQAFLVVHQVYSVNKERANLFSDHQQMETNLPVFLVLLLSSTLVPLTKEKISLRKRIQNQKVKVMKRMFSKNQIRLMPMIQQKIRKTI